MAAITAEQGQCAWGKRVRKQLGDKEIDQRAEYFFQEIYRKNKRHGGF